MGVSEELKNRLEDKSLKLECKDYEPGLGWTSAERFEAYLTERFATLRGRTRLLPALRGSTRLAGDPPRLEADIETARGGYLLEAFGFGNPGLPASLRLSDRETGEHLAFEEADLEGFAQVLQSIGELAVHAGAPAGCRPAPPDRRWLERALREMFPHGAVRRDDAAGLAAGLPTASGDYSLLAEWASGSMSLACAGEILATAGLNRAGLDSLLAAIAVRDIRERFCEEATPAEEGGAPAAGDDSFVRDEALDADGLDALLREQVIRRFPDWIAHFAPGSRGPLRLRAGALGPGFEISAEGFEREPGRPATLLVKTVGGMPVYIFIGECTRTGVERALDAVQSSCFRQAGGWRGPESQPAARDKAAIPPVPLYRYLIQTKGKNFSIEPATGHEIDRFGGGSALRINGPGGTLGEFYGPDGWWRVEIGRDGKEAADGPD